ncbi:MAG: CCA tRNA nucleotidyltransferase [Anaerolineales bacterium]|nr:CCA tRNA nucleotidyltransferase [Anaerolineales bacterium]
MTWSPKHPAFQSLLAALSAATKPVYVVGGVIRDALLGNERPATDLDVVIGDSAIPVARAVADKLGWAFYPLDPLRDVARLVFTATTPRLSATSPPCAAVQLKLICARDFTVNALAVEWEGRRAIRMVDPTGGESDIRLRCIRRVAPTSLPEDPVRMLRAFRFAHQLDFTIEEETRPNHPDARHGAPD